MTSSPTVDRNYVIEGMKNLEAVRVQHALDHMVDNKAYRYAVGEAGGDTDGAILEQFRERYRAYRRNWRSVPRQAITEGRFGAAFAEMGTPPLCVDIEVAAVCDLACPFCFRQWIATPDKIIDDALFFRLIAQCRELGVPSVKLNWRGEPLLHPKLPEYIDYAKRAGILEVLINTNATTLDDKKSRALIEAGLDVLIYSFDGASRETYQKMRPGRFGPNTFDDVYGNIRRFSEIRAELRSVWPRTKIQMVITEDTFEERHRFFELFSSCVDDVSVKAYTERGGKIAELDAETRRGLEQTLRERDLAENVPFWRDLAGNVYIATRRLPCEQPFQRLMVTYDGRVSMCCYDWGSEYPVGYVDERAIREGDSEYKKVLDKAQKGAKGFELMAEAVMPQRYTEPAHQVESLGEIWRGPLIEHVREQHIRENVEAIEACTRCTFKETYEWHKVGAGRDPESM